VAEPFLVADDVTVRYGGVVAVDRVSVSVARGEVAGLIGPNGAGKTTMFGAICGTVPMAGGRVTLDGVDVSGWPAHRRARAGLGRTFQRVQLFGSLSVRDNLAFATEAPTLGARPWQLLRRDLSRPSRVDELLHDLSLAPVADRPVAALPIGVRRVVEFGRALCADPRVLLLDEPFSGLDETESAQFAAHVRAAAERAIGVLLVEHDMHVVMALCTHIHVLDFGRLIAAGDPATVRSSDAVRTAYLGSGDAA
jgi:branched-chain amino acid transport system ATP-binding protein